MPLSIAASLGAGILALLFALWLVYQVMKEDEGTDTMRAIARAIQKGAVAFLWREYAYLGAFVLAVAIVVGIFIAPQTAVAYVLGAVVSATAGFLGMTIATRANVRTASAARRGLNPALRIAFKSGAVMGMCVVGLGLVGVGLLYFAYTEIFDSSTTAAIGEIMEWITGFSFGVSSVALFARVGGGIYTKAADVGADLVGKVEQGIPEDDPRNPATIADNVGDNVGDVAGMGADLFESYIVSIISAMAIAVFSASIIVDSTDASFMVLPLLIAGAGIACSIIGTFFVRTREGASFSGLLWALRRGIFVADALILVAAFVIINFVLDFPEDGTGMKLFWCIVVGLASGIIIGLATEYFTSYEYSPTKKVAKSAETGPATVIISGFATGMHSTLIPTIIISVATLASFQLFGFYGVAIAAIGMLSTLGITLATDAYGPVADNAGGIAEQSHLPAEVRERTDALDSLGNTTAATGKGFAIGSAALSALVLIATYVQAVTPEGAAALTIDLLDSRVIAGLLIGAVLPFVFSALTMQAVGHAAFAMVQEVRRQFREIPGIMDRSGTPDYAKCVDISTRSALRAMVFPGVMAVSAPIAVGFVMGPGALGGLLIGALSAGFMLAITMAAAGGAWDNAKKYIEAGQFGGKGSKAHAAAVVGDTVGDPFKDTSGPSLNILFKLMAIVALVFAPVLASFTPLWDRF